MLKENMAHTSVMNNRISNISFSILIPAYKVLFLESAISSVLKQTYDHFELIIVDDASPDDIYMIVKKFEDSRIKYYRNKTNFGKENVVDNWNECLNHATGEYVICMGDDDILNDHCLSEYVSLIQKYPNCSVYHGRTTVIDEQGKDLAILESRDEWESVYSAIYYRWRGRSQFIGDFCFRSSELKRNEGFYKLPLAWASDDITVVMLAKEAGIANCNTPIFKYRINQHSISSNPDADIKIDSILKEQIWYHSFLQSALPQTAQDKHFLHLILDEEYKYFLKKKIGLIIYDISMNFKRGIRWLSCSKKNGLTKITILYCIIMASLERFKRAYIRR